ncbi:hypothetical protein QO003_000046 [Arthrobacter silviterrae]|uniref:Uncharacterized protein n=1 Tax=Arthrobacter silviterrae TaxID=2026658 RepID=A0ABX0D8D0_9MICC|nr:hypothetical protein [Arthrobacter silviterrae]MDQ0275743.1 hypothetical protein [Arthrobacter silviterrae]NGN83159.1 hypothetical protein [Arthrobacter silviterrae]
MEQTTFPIQSTTFTELLELCQTRLGMTASAARAHILGLLAAANVEHAWTVKDPGTNAALALAAGNYRRLPNLI